jgi:cysteinyl-tRNA synthetase
MNIFYYLSSSAFFISPLLNFFSLDTPNALKYIDEAFDQLKYDNLSHFALDNLISFIDNYLGLSIRNTTPDIAEIDKEKIRARSEAKENKDFARADQIRDELLSNNLTLNDSSNQTIWARE